MGEAERIAQLEQENAYLRLENENLQLKLEQKSNYHGWIWALIPITAIIVGGFSEIWGKIIDIFF